MQIISMMKSSPRAVKANAEAKTARSVGTPAQRIAADVESALGADWIPRIYRERILSQRTRSHELPVMPGQRAARVTVQHTLLGVELKIGKRRMFCPDLATARYLAVFARAGSASAAVPHNITKISRLADELETSWERMMLLAAEGSANPALRSRVQNLLIAKLRGEIENSGEEKKSTFDSQALLKSKPRTTA